MACISDESPGPCFQDKRINLWHAILSLGTSVGVGFAMDLPQAPKEGDHIAIDIEKLGHLESKIGR